MFSRLMRIIKPGDRRKERRVKVRLPADVGGFSGRVTDLSLGGFGFYPDQEGLEVGDEVMATLKPNPDTQIELPSRIVGTDEEGMVLCIAFMKVGPDQFDPLQDIITDAALG